MAAENKLENAAISYARSLGILTYKFVSPSNRGVPDRVFIFPGGVTLWVEFKAPKKKPSPLQIRTLSRMAQQGSMVAVVDNLAGFFDITDRLMTKKLVLTDK
jgi:hypothetical protein